MAALRKPPKPSFLYLSKDREFKAKNMHSVFRTPFEDFIPKISQIDEVPCQAEVRILQKITLKIVSNEYDSCMENKAGERGLRFKTKSFNSRAVEGR